jgi:hypothetical protein
MFSNPIRATLIATTFAVATASAVTSAAAAPFDGQWSVLIVTRSGACDPTFRTGVFISNGIVQGAGGASVSGRVSNSGAVHVTVSSGGSRGSGSGRLSRTGGGGTWAGVGSRGRCTGTWSASRGG